MSNNTSETENLTVYIPSGATTGNYYILYVADYDKTYTETYETNNVAYSAFTVISTACTDGLEPNNLYSQATNIGSVTSYSNSSLCLSLGDEDWFRYSFNGTQYYFLVEGYNSYTDGDYGQSFSISGSVVTIATNYICVI